ncbi:hypothetical protein KW785_00815 [Candidatus Parcubacteria bacterium]|nr:hypothetical protein [Candidatus Parcubacteria bacterium]
MPPESTSHKDLRFNISTALLIVLIVGGLYYWYGRTKTVVTPIQTTNTIRNIVTQTPVVSGQPAGSPTGFPSDIPVETANITQSYRVSYPDSPTARYTVSYTTNKTKDALWKIYTDYFKTAGYTIDTKVTDKTKGVFRATKGLDEIDIYMTPQKGGGELVQVTYLNK